MRLRGEPGVSQLHGVVASVSLAGVAGLAVVASANALLSRAPPWLDLARRVLLVALVVESAVGLALVLGGASPREWLHWAYGVAAAVTLFVPAALAPNADLRSQTWLLAATALVATLLVWRLAATG